MKCNKILVVYKKSNYERLVLGRKSDYYSLLLKRRNPSVKRLFRSHKAHKKTYKIVTGCLKSLNIPFKTLYRRNIKNVRGYDLIITIGGDGTFLATSHMARKTPILGVNSMPETSRGFFCSATAETFAGRLKAFIKGRSKIKKVVRLELMIGGKKIGPPALNDILFCNANPAGTARYTLKLGGRAEDQQSSGIWISPPGGSTAATMSAGGKKLPLTKRVYQFVVREPFRSGKKRLRLLNGVLSKKKTITIIPNMEDGIFFVDGAHESFRIRRGEKATVKFTHPSLVVQ